jgi:hypothetical protein
MTSEEKFKEFIKNKKVIFVGPSPILKERNLGNWIDEFDIVCRTNGAINLINNVLYQKDYGKRCDILYSNVQFIRESHPLPIDKFIKELNLKFICFKAVGQSIFDYYNMKLPCLKINEVVGRMQILVQGVLMGVIILQHLSEYKPKELWFTGMDFFTSKDFVFKPNHYVEYFEGYLPDKVVKQANIKNMERIDPHDIISNTEYINSMYKKGIVKTNDFIEKIMMEVINNKNKYSIDAKFKANRKK